MIKHYLVFGLALITTVVISVAMKEPLQKSWNEEDRSKLLKFSHTFHVKEQGISCTDCHITVAESKVSSDNLLGNHENCTSCHEDNIADNCGFCHTDPDNITPFKNPERELIFSHELHVTTHTLSCENCHTGLDTVTYASQKNMPSMSTCLNCHQQEKVSINCETCHTDFVSLVPDDHLATDFRRDHKKLTRLGVLDVSCATCHTENFCQSCHTGIELQGFTGMRDLMTEPVPRTFTKDSPKQLKLQQVHDLNYRFTHSIDAKLKSLDCASCHEEQTFCVSCHQAGGNITQQKIVPEWHTVSGFVIPFKGSGGGRHAEMARRDLESCASCHDVQGKDPTCTLCHTENGGVR